MLAIHFFFAVERFSFDGPDAYYHVCTDGRSLDWMFQGDSDFRAGVNRAGICMVLSGVRIVSFVLMDNHVHFVLQGTMPSCKEFIVKFKNLTGKYISSRYGIKGHIHTLSAEIIKIDTPDRLISTLAYIDRNPIVAGWRRMPDESRISDYRYGGHVSDHLPHPRDPHGGGPQEDHQPLRALFPLLCALRRSGRHDVPRHLLLHRL